MRRSRSMMAPRRGRRWLRVLGVAAIAAGAAMVAWSTLDAPDPLIAGEAIDEDEDGTRQVVELHTPAGRRAATVLATSRAHADDARMLRLHVEQPDPVLDDLTVRLDPEAAGLASNRVLLGPLSGDWPEARFGLDDDGRLELASRGLGFNTTVVELWIPPDAELDDPGTAVDEALPIDLEMELDDGSLMRPQRYRGSVHLRLPV